MIYPKAAYGMMSSPVRECMRDDVNNQNLSGLVDLGITAVSDAAPCGENVRYEPVFEELEAELAKQQSLAAETVDWDRVIELSSSILQSSAKDMLVAAYLCQALFIKNHYAGLNVGLKILADMVEQHWLCLFPPIKRLRARGTAISWLSEMSAAHAGGNVPAADESESLIEAVANLRRLDNELADKMGDQAPMVTDLSRLLKNYKQSAEAELANAAPTMPVTEKEPVVEAKPSVNEVVAAEANIETTPAATPPPVPATKTATEPKARKAASAVTVGDVTSDADVKKAMRQIQDVSKRITGFWQAKKLSDARQYRLARLSSWMMIENVPPANDGVTQVNPPEAERLKFFELQIEKQEFDSVLPELEQTLSRSPFWLSGQYKVVTVMRALGTEYNKAVQTVIAETRHFLQRLPELLELSFADQTPFADDQTRMWLNTEVLTDNNASGDATGAPLSSAHVWDEALADAKKMALSGDKETAVELLNQGINQSRAQREQFYWRAALAELLLQMGSTSQAAAMLEQMSIQASESNINMWEPDLLSRVYQLLHQAYVKQSSKQKGNESLQQKVAQAYAQLSWFDPLAALTVKGE